MGRNQFTQEQKLAVLESAEKTGIKKAAEHAGVHYTTVYEWRRGLEALGRDEFLEYEPSRPGRGIKKISAAQEEAVLAARRRNPGYGPGQVRNALRRQGMTVSSRTVRRIMEADGYRRPRKRSGRDESVRFEAGRPLELVQMDILEFHVNKLKVHIILLLDDYSRFITGFRLLERTSVDDVIGTVRDAVDRYGRMSEILTDRGFVFYSWRGANRFEKYLDLEGIDHTHARPHHPQTLGKVEAVNGRLKRELLTVKRFSGRGDAEKAVSEWIGAYNYERPHQGLGGLLVPAERFHGRSAEALRCLDKGVDVTAGNWYGGGDAERSVMNLVLSPEGGIRLYLLGRPIELSGGFYGGGVEPGGGRDTDQSPPAAQEEGPAEGRGCDGDLRGGGDIPEDGLRVDEEIRAGVLPGEGESS